MSYTKDELFAETGISERGSQARIVKRERKKRKALQFAEAENVVEHFLENRMDPNFSKAWDINSNRVKAGEIPPQYFLDTLGKLEIFQTDPMGEQQAIHRVLVALIKANILEKRITGPSGPKNRAFGIVDAARFSKSNDDGEQFDETKIVTPGW